jgi:pSer/pThr/pTyr-binding forkhead associated (FHA) protein
MQVVLVMLRSDGERRSFSIVRDVTVIGRREDCDFRIPLGDISRKHCRLVKENGSLRVQDLGSSNGTFVNGKRVQEYEISPGDSIQIGGVAFVVQIDGVPAEEEIAQPPQEQSAVAPAAGSSSGEFDPLTALEDSNMTELSESQIHRDLLGELGDSATREQQA